MSYYTKRAREPISSLTHLYGALISAAGLVLLLVKTLIQSEISWKEVFSAGLFGFSLVALYTASSVYHFSNAAPRILLLLRKLDHAMIYVLIAGTYTPVMLNLLPFPNNIGFTIFIWCFALAGIIIKLSWFDAPRWLQTSLYLVMGWSILASPSVFLLMSPGAIALLSLGGASYTIGGIIYMVKKPNLSAGFGFHELFHLFVLLGSLFHFLLVYCYIIA